MNDGATRKTMVGWPVNEIWALTLHVDLEDHQDILSDNQRDDIGPRLVVLQDVKWWLISRVDGDFTRVSFGKSSEYPDPSSNQYVQTSNPRQRKNNPNNERNQRNEQRMSNGWSWFSPFDMSFFGAKKQMCSVNVQTDPAAHRQQVGELCQIIQVLRRYGETEMFQPQKWWIFNRKLWDFPAWTVMIP